LHIKNSNGAAWEGARCDLTFVLFTWTLKFYCSSMKSYLCTYSIETIAFPAAISLEKHCQKNFLDNLKLHRTFDTKVTVVLCWIMMVCIKVNYVVTWRWGGWLCHNNITDNLKISNWHFTKIYWQII